MRFFEVPGHHPRQLAIGREHHIHQEIGIRHAAGFQQIFVRGIAVQNSRRAARIEDHLVSERGGAPSGDARRQQTVGVNQAVKPAQFPRPSVLFTC